MNFKTKYIPAFAALALGATTLMTSCDDYLDVSPDSAFSNKEIFSNPNDTKAALATVYSTMCSNNLYGYNFPFQFNTNTDVEMKEYSSETSNNANGGDVGCFDMQPTWSSLLSTWNQAYNAINYANDFIENIVEVGGIKMTDTQLDEPTDMQHMYGEARCLRALIYFDLMRTWGDVVFTTASAKAGDEFYEVPVTDRDVISAWLIEDLKDAEHYMKYAANLDEGVQRCGREFCQALIGQIALYRGGFTLRDGGTVGEMKRRDDWREDYETAKEYLGKVIKEGKHSLDKETFEQMWTNEMNFTVLNNGDVIFEVPLRKEGSGNLGYSVGIVIGYDTNAPHAFGKSSNNMTFCGMFPFTYDQRDLRLDVTCVPYAYDTEMNHIWGLGSKCVTGWGCGKWDKTKVSADNKLATYEGSTGVNNIRMRYADVLLMYAEVCNELGADGDAMSVKDCLKTVRKRAFKSELQDECVVQYVDRLNGHDAIFKAIMDERSWEFAGEGVRKYDLARWGVYGKVLKENYNKYRYWALAAYQDSDPYVRGYVKIRYDKAVNDKDILEWRGLKELCSTEAIGPTPNSAGWVTKDYAKNWYALDADTQEFDIISSIRWSYRNFINYNNCDEVGENDPVRYLMPYPESIISSHRGSISQMYGYR